MRGAARRGGTQTAPQAGPPPAGETLADCGPFAAANELTLGPRGYSFTIVAATEVFSDNDFGNFQPGGRLSEVPDPGPDQYVHAQFGPDPDPEDHRRRGDR